MKNKTHQTFCLSIIIAGCLTNSEACQQGGGSTSIVQMPTLGGSFIQLNAMNEAGQVTGLGYLPGDLQSHAFLFSGSNTVDLGTFGGLLSEGLSINNSGVVSGDADLGDNQTHAFIYGGVSLADISPSGASFSSAAVINDSGQVAGTAMYPDGSIEAFIYAAGVVTNLGSLGGNYAVVHAMNQAGNVAGDSVTDLSDDHAFLYSNGVMSDLGTLGGFYSFASTLNDSNVVAGESSLANGDIHAFVFRAGSINDLGTLGGSFSTAIEINNAGQIAGNATTEGDVETHGCLFDGSQLTDLGTLGGNYSSVSAMNTAGQVVGNSATSGGSSHAFLWRNGEMIDLNTLLPTNSGWELLSANLINDSGRIAGFGLLNGIYSPFVLTVSVANKPPLADAGTNQTVDCQAQVTLDGSRSSDPDNDVLTYQWSESNQVLGTNSILQLSLPVGVHQVSLTVTDPCGASASANVQITVADSAAPAVTCPAPITANVGNNCQAPVPDVTGVITATDNCAAQSSLIVSQSPAAGTLVGPGAHDIIVSVADPSGNTGSCTVSFTVVDSQAPTIVGGPSIPVLAAGEGCQAAVPSVTGDIVASDNCTPVGQLVISQSPAAGTLVGIGQHLIVVTVTDASHNSTQGSLTFSVADTTVPVIQSVTASPNVLSPANGRAVPVTVSVSATDNCDFAPVSQIVSVTSNEPVASGDVTITGALTVTLVADRNPGGSGRVYTITVKTTDASGNSSNGTVLVSVPKGNGKKP